MCNDTASTAANATTAVTTVPAGKLRMSDIVGNDYKDWRNGMRIIFDAGTNSGKTYFILNVLLPWAYEKDRKILYLCNRSPLRDQIRRSIEELGRTENKVGYRDIDSKEFVYETHIQSKYEYTIRVENYQWLEWLCKENPTGASDYLRRFYYVVADEYHYQLTDPSINEEIDVSYKLLNKWTETKPVIFMSATAHPFFNYWKETGKVVQENYYYLPPDYSFTSKVKFFWTDDEELAVIRQEAQRGKVLVFVDSIDHINKIRDALEKNFPGEIATACSEYRPEAKEFDGLTAVLQDEKLCKRISIVTTVFYNGINIVGYNLKCNSIKKQDNMRTLV